MEQDHYQGGEHHQQDRLPHEQADHLTDEQLIYHGITEALREQRSIDHATARAIAAQLHGGQASPLYALASSGVLVEGLRAELDGWRREDTPVELEPWLDALDEYLDSRDDLSPVDGWSQLWPTPPERDDDEPADDPETERPPHGSARDLGRVASGAVVDQPRGIPPGEHSAGDIPQLQAYGDCDGYEWIERLPEGWHAVPSWGRDGWDLGRWPLCIVTAYENPDTETYAFGVYTEGDITVRRQASQAELHAAIDELAEWYWRNGYAHGPSDLSEGKGLLAHHRGPLGWERLRREEIPRLDGGLPSNAT